MKKTADIFGICYKSISFMLVVSLIVTPALAQNTNIVEQKSISPQRETQTSQEETQTSQEETQTSQEETQTPQEETQTSQEETQTPQEETQTHKRKTQTPQEETQNTEQIGGEDITLNAITDARQDAQMEINGGLWFIVGCFGGCIGWIIAYAIEPNPPATRLMGKSPEYVAAYTDTYREAAKKIQTSQALTGCLVGTAISLVLQLLISSSIQNSSM